MHEPTRFGEFLLLKKLSEDPLGEVYRAGRVDGTALAEIDLLRIFSIPDLDGGPLVEAMEGYKPFQADVQGPGVVHFRRCGQVGGVAWAVYDYTSGWDLGTLIQAVRGGYSELELDHAVLLIERMAKGLSQVHKLESGGRPFHGFLTPHTVRVTDEGEIQLLGFETGPLFAAFAHLGHLGRVVHIQPPAAHQRVGHEGAQALVDEGVNVVAWGVHEVSPRVAPHRACRWTDFR